MNTTACPHCNSQQDVPSHYLGRQIKCRQCGGDYTAKLIGSSSATQATKSSKKAYFIGPIIGALVVGGGVYAYLNQRTRSVEIHSTNNKVTEVAVKRVEVPEMFRTQMLKFLESGSKMKALSERGVSFAETRDALTDVRASWDMTLTMWPSDLDRSSVDFFEKSLKAWDGCIDLWKLKIADSDMPTSPDINGWSRYQQQFGDDLVVRTHDGGYIVENYRGREYLPFDENISALLGVGTTEFFLGRDLVLQQIK